MKPLVCKVIALFFTIIACGVQAQVAIEDGNLTIDREELERTIASWPKSMRVSAANDLGDRLELLNLVVVNKKMALEAEKLAPQTDGDVYWKYYFARMKMQRKFIFDSFMATLQIPDMSALAEERYDTQKDKYALISEKRKSSHILLSSPPGVDRGPVRAKADEVLVALDTGSDFDQLAAAHSTDPGTKDSGGRMDRWMSLEERGLSPNYTIGLFEIAEIGGHSTIIETEFGLHIIRLDDIQEAYYKPYAEVREAIIADLQGEYRTLAAKEYTGSFRVGDDLRIDGELLEELLQEYKTEEN